MYGNSRSVACQCLQMPDSKKYTLEGGQSCGWFSVRKSAPEMFEVVVELEGRIRQGTSKKE